ncbi:hypothetical protein G3I60_08925 [Streptomyces sp. SID13666]|uniref:hypothetical protein n=1 Tax=unclassified Streptomyces TaxID=2593676 RepID=UPI0013C15542|nr:MULTISPECIES: hypothetical protein [unclassified Streptomyces]NEA54270.1 hypothetical protein [Streptomyces sp. SID13666]NEA70365.1 hypothetical protein [Streptomyces sp. SID13588]
MTGVGADAYLLIWMHERSAQGMGGLAGPEDFPEEWKRGSRFRLRADLNDLVRRGQMERNFVFRRGNLYRLTHAGELEARRLLHLRRDPEGRQQHAHNGLITAASRASYSPTIGLEAFLAMPQSHMYGDSLTLDEVRVAAGYLVERGLATLYEGNTQHPLEALLTLTGVGIQCAESPLLVKDFLMQNGHLPTYDIDIHGGSNIQVGQENVQNNNSGFDPSQFIAFARQVLAAAPRVEITDELRGQIVRDAFHLEEEGTRPAPEPSRVRRALDGLMETLVRHSTDGVAQLLYDAGRSLLP